ncbi:MAG: class I SAM-dependent methyltransferase [Planctomycetes bacterium]|nr:class I SAM-dependent methyltransferase [Planctomycetota bacterium]
MAVQDGQEPRRALAASERAARLAARAAPRQGGFEHVALPALPDVPGMIAPAEQRYLYWLTSATFTGQGAVVEVGTWLGKSALHLAAGLRDAGLGGALYCFDRFRWREHAAAPQGLAPGSDTAPLVRSTLLPVHQDLVLTSTEIKDLRWRQGPIEILFLDAPKAHRPFVHCLREFGPSLLPGVSLLASQDFAYPRAYAQALCLGRLADRLEMVHVAGNLAGFVVRKPLPEGRALSDLLDERSFAPAESLRIWDAFLARIEEQKTRTHMRPGICLHLYARGERRLACRMIRETEFTPHMLKRWGAWAAERETYRLYPGLFAVLGLGPARRFPWPFRRAR